MRTVPLLSEQPVFDRQPVDAAELAGVVCDQHSACGLGMCGDEHVYQRHALSGGTSLPRPSAMKSGTLNVQRLTLNAQVGGENAMRLIVCVPNLRVER